MSEVWLVVIAVGFGVALLVVASVAGRRLSRASRRSVPVPPHVLPTAPAPPAPGAKAAFRFVVTKHTPVGEWPSPAARVGAEFAIRRSRPGAICRLSGRPVDACTCGEHVA